MPEISFNERVKNVIVSAAKAYKQTYVDYEYLLCSDDFVQKDFYIIDAKLDNYQHLTGVNSLISPQEFYKKCYDGTLEETDFNFIKTNQNEKIVKGSVRRKIAVLPDMMNIFDDVNMVVEENFIKNQIVCTIATSNNKCTVGFINNPKSRPMTLLKGNVLDITKAKSVNLLLRKHVTKKKFDEIVIGDAKTLNQYYDKIKEYIDESINPNK